ncbi:MAG: replication protein C [Methanocorpusculum parvum]|nr:replication protein C [Methanocorpusculum parvum]
MLWIEKYRPQTFDSLLGQTSAAKQLTAYAEAGNLPHLMVIGRSGVGKTAALEIFSRGFYTESPAENTTVLPVSVMFSQGHTYFAENERFAHLYQKGKSVLANFKYIVKWHASLKPLSAPFRLIIFDGAGDLPKDAQAALRRIMERYSQTCRFIFVTNTIASLIDPIRSRCVPLYFLPIEDDVMISHLRTILDAEGCNVPEDMLEMIVLGAKGDVRKAVMWLELAARYGVDDPLELSQTETGCMADACIRAMVAGDADKGRQICENLMIEYGLSAADVLSLLRKSIRAYITPDIALLFSRADIAIRAGQNEYLQMNAFAAELSEMLR